MGTRGWTRPNLSKGNSVRKRTRASWPENSTSPSQTTSWVTSRMVRSPPTFTGNLPLWGSGLGSPSTRLGRKLAVGKRSVSRVFWRR
jgi:hypothetical protein